MARTGDFGSRAVKLINGLEVLAAVGLSTLVAGQAQHHSRTCPAPSRGEPFPLCRPACAYACACAGLCGRGRAMIAGVRGTWWITR
jgi:hypothetical protein